MIINKKAALFFLVCNAVLVAIHAFLHFYFHYTVFLDPNKPAAAKQLPYWQIIGVIELFIRLCIYWGIVWVLKKVGAPRWIRVGMIIFVTWQIVVLVFVMIFANLHLMLILSIPGILYFLNVLILLYLLYAFIRLQANSIKIYLICFDILMLFAFTSSSIGGYLYDHFNFRWLLFSPTFISALGPVSTLILFVDVYNLANKKPAPEQLSTS
jgi:hypothetical protein